MPNKIKVHEKALAHLSRGLYRSPASALRELVSNAWDANATRVRIDTNYPHFHQLTIEDNGRGFSHDDFKKLMDGGIGNSEKRASGERLVHDRPTIGRIGIGMLGIAQICGSFTVTSKPRSGRGFSAQVKLYDLLKGKLDSNNAEVVQRKGEVDVGTYDFDEDFDSDRHDFGTRILSTDVHPTFARSFQQSVESKGFKQPPLNWNRALPILSRVRSLQEMGDYWRLLWELAAACPVPYLDKNALPESLVEDDQVRLLNYDFEVIADGITLFKPVLLRGNPGGYTVHRIKTTRTEVYGKDLTFHGYIVVQEGAQIKPDELRGVMLRIRNVGIGYYDPSMLDYRINEGPRSRWLTGEIYIDQGLEDALNIDRDSFNRFHPEFRAVQEFLHQVLQKEVFPDVYRQIDVRSKKRETEKRSKRIRELTTLMSSRLRKEVRLRGASSHQQPGRTPQAQLMRTTDGIDLILPELSTVKTKKTHRELASAILALFEVALEKKTRGEQRETFSRMLLDLLSKW